MLPLPLLVFTDLDGTLLCHTSYSWQHARPALDALRAVGAGVVLASSKTAQEVLHLRAELELSDWPAIVENGAGLLPSGGQLLPDTGDYEAIRRTLATLDPNLRQAFAGFGDLTLAQIKAETGLSEEDAARAQSRCFSEPGLWTGTSNQKTMFLNALKAAGIHAREGGRFLTLSFGRTKADRMAQIISDLRPTQTLALGDAPNDVEMLDTADVGVIVANPHKAPLPTLPGEAEGRITRTQAAGPEGWNSAVLELLNRLNLM